MFAQRVKPILKNFISLVDRIFQPVKKGRLNQYLVSSEVRKTKKDCKHRQYFYQKVEYSNIENGSIPPIYIYAKLQNF